MNDLDECRAFTRDHWRKIVAIKNQSERHGRAWYALKIALRGCTYDVSILREYERLECARRERDHD
jgi:hypothetical protein